MGTVKPIVILAVLLGSTWSAPLGAQSYPAKPIRVVVPFSAGGGEDHMTRLLAPRLAELLGQPVVIDNRPGAGGVIGWDHVAKAPPDGYTLVTGGASMMRVPSLRANAPVDVLRDFTPIGMFAVMPLVLVVHPSVPAKDLKELIALARARPGKLTYASAGGGQIGHLASEVLKSSAKIDMLHVPYKNAPIIYADLMSGQVDMFVGNMASALPHVRTGRLRAVAVAGEKRAAALPEVPTVAEGGLAGYDFYGWNAVHAPSRVPREIVVKLNAAIHKAIAVADLRERISAAGAEPRVNTPEAMGEIMKSAVARFGTIIRAASIKAE